MQEEYKKERKFIHKSLAGVIKKLREEKSKSISTISNEFNISKTIWADAERGETDIQLTSLWRISEALDMSLSELISLLEKELPENWSFTEK